VQISVSIIETLFKEHHKALCNFANNIVRDRDAAEDIVQEVFLKLWRRRADLDLDSPIKPYLYKSTSNTALNWIDKNKRNVRLDQVPEPEGTRLTEENFNAKELENRIKWAIDRLPPKCKAIFLLNRLEGMKYKEVALHLDLSVKTVENQMGIALDKLRSDLQPYLTKEFLAITTLLIGLLLTTLF